MPSGTTIQQFVNDLRDRKSTIAHKFDDVYNYCKGNATKSGELVAELRAWKGTPNTLPDLGNYGADSLNSAEKAHISAWPGADKVINAMVRALEDNARDIEFFWDLDDDDLTEAAPSKSVIEPAAAGDPLPPPGVTVTGTGGAGPITVIFLTPRSKVKQSIPTILGITIGGINLEV